MKPKRPTPEQLDQARFHFNQIYPVGTEVLVKLDDGELMPSVIEGEAYVMGGHSLMVFLKGIRGSFMASRVQDKP